jgi:hypothetical protein
MARKTTSNGSLTKPASATGEVSADASLAQAQKTAPYFKKQLADMPMHADMDSVREADYNGHHIVVRTTYKITIDGKPFDAGLGVTNAGNVHYHGIPNVAFASAIDLVKAVIDTFPDEFAKGPGGHEHHGHAGMPMDGASVKRKSGKRAAKRPRR